MGRADMLSSPLSPPGSRPRPLCPRLSAPWLWAWHMKAETPPPPPPTPELEPEAEVGKETGLAD